MLLDMLLALDPDARVFALDTHVLFPETYAVWREVEQRYGTKVAVYEGPSLGRQAAAHGDELWKTQPDALLRDPQGRAARPRARRPRRLDHRHPPRPVADARERAEGRLGRGARALEGEPARRLGRTSAAGTTSTSASCRTTSCTTAATRRSAARTARRRAPGREGRWAGAEKIECGLHTAEQRMREPAASSSGSPASRPPASRRSPALVAAELEAARAARRPARRRRRARAPVEGSRLLEGGPRHEHRAHRLGRLAARPRRRRRRRLGDLAVRGDAAARARARRGARDVRRGLRRDVARGVRAPRPEGPLREGARRRDRRVHRRLRSVRGAVEPGAAPRHRGPHARGVGARSCSRGSRSSTCVATRSAA